MHAGNGTSVEVRRSDDNFLESVQFFYREGSRGRIQVTSLAASH